MGKIGIVLYAGDFHCAYSVAGVVLDHIWILERKGWEIVLFVPDFFDSDSASKLNVEIRKYPAPLQQKGICSSECIKNMEAYLDKAIPHFVDIFKDISTCITHDVMLVKRLTALNQALRGVAEKLPGVKWYHWLHSIPFKYENTPEYPFDCFFKIFPNSRYIFGNNTDANLVSKAIGCPEEKVSVIQNIVNPCRLYQFDPVSVEILERISYWQADIICVYPARISDAKNFDKMIDVFAALKQLGLDVRLVFCDIAPAREQQIEREKLLLYGRAASLSEMELLFTSTVFSDSACSAIIRESQRGLPQKVVQDLFSLSDLFLLPSQAEACSMVMLEAALAKSRVILNSDLASFGEFGGKPVDDRVEYFPFQAVDTSSSVEDIMRKGRRWSGRQAIKCAKMILSGTKKNTSLNFFKHVRKFHSPWWIYEKRLAPLFAAGDH